VIDEAVRRRPLAHLAAEVAADEAPAKAGLVLGEHAFRGKLNLRGDLEDAGFLEAVAAALGVALPTEANGVTEAKRLAVLWLGPDKWLVVTAPGHERLLAEMLEETLAGRHISVVDVSDQQRVIVLAGGQVRTLLAKDTSLDFAPPSFAPGRCVQIPLARALVAVHQRDDRSTFDIYVDHSYAEYLWRWLETAAGTLAPLGPRAGGGAR
jgi:sarcosine oxidase subunit gamma